MPKDLDQAAKMLNLRIKIDVWSQGVDERIRVKNREQLRDLFCQLSPRRVFCYLKYTRNMQLKRTEPDERAPFTIEGPEDIIADGKLSSPTFSFISIPPNTTDSMSIIPH